MNALRKTMLAFGAMALLACPALAQRPPGGGGGGMMMEGAGMLLNKGVQQELNLSSDQIVKAEKIAQESREKHRDEFMKLRDLKGEDRFEKAHELRKAVYMESRDSLKDVLKPEQLKRYTQLQLQAHAVEALSDHGLQEKLKVTDDQKAKLKEIRHEAGEKMEKLFQDSQSGDRQAAFGKFRGLRKETVEKTVDVLTDEQKATWKEMTGEPYEFKFEGPRPGGARGR